MGPIEIIVALGSLGLSIVAFIAATRAQGKTQRLEQVKVDAEAYTRAQSIYDKSFDQLSRRNDQLCEQLKECEARVERLEQTPPQGITVQGDGGA